MLTIDEPRRIDAPAPGHWMMRLCKGGVEVPACLSWEPTPAGPLALVARIRGEVVDVDAVWLHRGRPVTKAWHDYMLALARWCDENDPDNPYAHPRKPIDFNRMRPVF